MYSLIVRIAVINFRGEVETVPVDETHLVPSKWMADKLIEIHMALCEAKKDKGRYSYEVFYRATIGE